MLKPCTKLPHEIDKGCLDQFLSLYKVVSLLGVGKEGIVFGIRTIREGDTGVLAEWALKVCPAKNKAVYEIETSCMLNELHAQTPIFIQTFGWMSCTEIPDEWYQYARATMKKESPLHGGPYLMVVTEPQGLHLNGKKFRFTSEYEWKCHFFLFLHGIYCARKQFKYAHMDIYEKNILFVAQKTPSVDVHVGAVAFSCKNMLWIPRLIDQGGAITHTFPNTASYVNNDIENLCNLFEKKAADFPACKDFVRKHRGLSAIRFSVKENYQEIEPVLLDKFFDELRSDVKIDPVNMRCASCLKLMYGGTFCIQSKLNFIHFCSEHCASKVSSLRPALKEIKMTDVSRWLYNLDLKYAVLMEASNYAYNAPLDAARRKAWRVQTVEACRAYSQMLQAKPTRLVEMEEFH